MSFYTDISPYPITIYRGSQYRFPTVSDMTLPPFSYLHLKLLLRVVNLVLTYQTYHLVVILNVTAASLFSKYKF